MNTLRPTVELIDDSVAEILRTKTAVERLKIAFGMWESARVILRAAIRAEYPDWSDTAVNREIAKRISHGVVDHAAYGSEAIANESRNRRSKPSGN